MKANCASGTDVKCGEGVEDEEAWRVAGWGEWCVGIVRLRCWLHRNMYVFIIPRLIEREREKDAATLSSGTDVKGMYSSTLPRSIGRGYDARHNDT